jgi:ABC-type bacteriocin/lantibiotic exporter with double-glycine peptidase domain
MKIHPYRNPGKTSPLVRLFFCPAAVFVLLLSGCAGKNLSDLLPGIQERGHFIPGVPFVKQDEGSCGPAALAGVMAFWGRPRSLEQIRAAVYLPELRGSLPMDMERYAREGGFQTSSSNATLDKLKSAIRSGTPVICLLDLGFGLYRKPHYVIVLGFDDEQAVVVEHDGLKPNRVVRYDAFQKAWSRAGRWMLVIEPSGFGKQP